MASDFFYVADQNTPDVVYNFRILKLSLKPEMGRISAFCKNTDSLYIVQRKFKCMGYRVWWKLKTCYTLEEAEKYLERYKPSAKKEKAYA